MIDAMNAEAILESYLEDKQGYFSWDELSYSGKNHPELTITTTVPFEVLEEYTGSEGDYSADTFIVFRLGDKTFKKTGHYQSHYGNDWDGPVVEVARVEKTVTVWEQV